MWRLSHAAIARDLPGRGIHSGELQPLVWAVQQLEQRSSVPSRGEYAALLRQCLESKSLSHTKRVHAHIASSGLSQSEHLVKLLVHVYGHCRDLGSAQAVFDGFSKAKDTVLWNTLMGAYDRNGEPRQALDVFFTMDATPDIISFMAALRCCAVLRALVEGVNIHKQVDLTDFRKETRVQNSLINMYAKCGSLEAARRIFDELAENRDLVSWNSIITAYAQSGHPWSTRDMYQRMQLEGVRPDGITFSSLLGSCRSRQEVKAIHDTALLDLKFDVFVHNALVTSYAKCGCLDASREVFDGMRRRDLVSWNAMIAAYAQRGHSQETLALYDSMESEGVEPDDITYACVLGACSQLGEVEAGRRIHDRVSRSKFNFSAIVETAVVNMYCKCGMVDEARRVFDRVQASKKQKSNVSSWNALIAGYVQQGRAREAVELFESMDVRGLEPDRITFTSVLGACCSLEDLELGTRVHELVIARGLDKDEVVETTLFNMYSKCGRIDTARKMFDGMQKRNVVAWNVMIAAYAQTGDLLHASQGLDLYGKMDAEGVQPDDITFIHALSLCSMLRALEEGKAVHARVLDSGCCRSIILETAIVSMYAKCNMFELARQEFDKIQAKTVVTWNALLAAYSQYGRCTEALSLYDEMNLEGVKPDGSTFVNVLSACSSPALVVNGRVIHQWVVESGYAALQTPLFNMYAKCGELEVARAMFDRMTSKRKTIVSWNAMITAYAHHGLGKEALELFDTMNDEVRQGGGVEPDNITFASALTACTSFGGWEKGQQIHDMIRSRGLQSDVVLETAIVSMYGKCGNLEAARRAFDEMGKTNAVTWAALITSYVQQGFDREALDLFAKMDSEGVQPNRVTLVCALAACSRLEALDEGKAIHSKLDKVPPAVESGLINMYAKCGQLGVARDMFDKSICRDPVSWNAMIGGYTQHGYLQEALDLYKTMRLEGTEASAVTFSCVLSACSQAGLLNEGRDCFISMVEHGVQPEAEHFVSMIDLFARAGRIQSAHELLENMPYEPYALAWSTLLGSCQTQGDRMNGCKYAGNVVELDPENTASYVLVCNMMRGRNS